MIGLSIGSDSLKNTQQNAEFARWESWHTPRNWEGCRWSLFTGWSFRKGFAEANKTFSRCSQFPYQTCEPEITEPVILPTVPYKDE